MMKGIPLMIMAGALAFVMVSTCAQGANVTIFIQFFSFNPLEYTNNSGENAGWHVDGHVSDLRYKDGKELILKTRSALNLAGAPSYGLIPTQVYSSMGWNYSTCSPGYTPDYNCVKFLEDGMYIRSSNYSINDARFVLNDLGAGFDARGVSLYAHVRKNGTGNMSSEPLIVYGWTNYVNAPIGVICGTMSINGSMLPLKNWTGITSGVFTHCSSPPGTWPYTTPVNLSIVNNLNIVTAYNCNIPGNYCVNHTIDVDYLRVNVFGGDVYSYLSVNFVSYPLTQYQTPYNVSWTCECVPETGMVNSTFNISVYRNNTWHSLGFFCNHTILPDPDDGGFNLTQWDKRASDNRVWLRVTAFSSYLALNTTLYIDRLVVLAEDNRTIAVGNPQSWLWLFFFGFICCGLVVTAMAIRSYKDGD